MEKSKGNKLRLGIFVSLSIAMFITGIYFVGQRQQLFSNTFHISGIFKDITGLQVGNNVRFSGINVGIVEDIHQITDSTVIVGMLVDEHSRQFMKKNAKAIIGSDGLMGNKIVLIIPGKPGQKPLDNGDLVETAQAISMDDILLKIKVTSDNSAKITEDLSAILDNIRLGKGTIGKLLMDDKFANNIDETMVNIKQGAGGFKQNMDAASHNFLLRGFFKKKKEKEATEKETNKKETAKKETAKK